MPHGYAEARKTVFPSRWVGWQSFAVMKRVFLGLAVVVALVAVVFWTVAGANRGWTKTSVAVKAVDEVTGLEGITYQSRFVPGLDFLGGALLAAGILAGASFVFQNKTNPQLKSENR